MALTHSTAGGRARPGGESRQRGELPRAGSDFGTRRAAFPPCPAGAGAEGTPFNPWLARRAAAEAPKDAQGVDK